MRLHCAAAASDGAVRCPNARARPDRAWPCFVWLSVPAELARSLMRATECSYICCDQSGLPFTVTIHQATALPPRSGCMSCVCAWPRRRLSLPCGRSVVPGHGCGGCVARLVDGRPLRWLLSHSLRRAQVQFAEVGDALKRSLSHEVRGSSRATWRHRPGVVDRCRVLTLSSPRARRVLAASSPHARRVLTASSPHARRAGNRDVRQS